MATSPGRRSVVILITVLVAVAAGGACWLVGLVDLADLAWGAAVTLALIPLGITVVRDLARGKTGVDLIALLAMLGSLILDQYLAGAVIGLMLSGGQALEGYAQSRARRELSSLLARAPRVVHRYENGELTSPDITAVRKGDLLLVKPGETVPVDGVIAQGIAILDESTITGESVPAERNAGDQVRSGAVNAGSPFDIHALSTADESTYAGIVRLVRDAEASKARFVRLADPTPWPSFRSRSRWLRSPGPCRAIRCVRSPCSWWRLRVRSSLPRPWP